MGLGEGGREGGGFHTAFAQTTSMEVSISESNGTD
jgi:hypothetical protein